MGLLLGLSRRICARPPAGCRFAAGRWRVALLAGEGAPGERWAMHVAPYPVVAGLAACAVLALASPASANDFCVNAPAGCAGTPVAAAGLSAALTAAQANGADDRFFLAPGTYTAAAF